MAETAHDQVRVGKRRASGIRPAEDYGFFGPGSMTWRVWSYPTSLTVGFQRAVTIEELDPALLASVEQTRAVYDRPRTRYDRTLRYFAMVAFADSRSISQAADVLVKVHSKAVGIEPLSGNRYDANDPQSQLWIHLTAWHSILYAYEKYGPGALTAEEDRQYWQECALAAELQTCDPADVPRSRAGVRQYFDDMRPRLAASEAAQNMMSHLLDARVMFPPVPTVFQPVAWLVAAILRTGTIATMPMWMRRMGGFRQPRIVDTMVTPLLRLAFRAARLSDRMQLWLLGWLSPSTVPVAGPVLLGIPPRESVTHTPAQARERYGYAKPAEAHPELRDRQAKRVFERHEQPSDEGITESRSILGNTG